MVDARGPELDGEPHPRPGRELVAVHAQAEPGIPPGESTRRASSSVKACGDAGSQKTSTQRAWGAQAASIGPQTRSR